MPKEALIMADSNNTVVFTDLIPYQDWPYVEVIRDFHKHLGSKETQDKIGLLNEVIKPYRKAKGDALAALRYMSLAVYMGGIMTPDCMHALEIVRNHKLNQQVKDTRPQATREEILEAWTELNGKSSKSETEKALEETGHVDAKIIEENAKSRKGLSDIPPQAMAPSQARKVNQDFRDSIDIAVFGSVEKANEIRNDFFGYDINKAFTMGITEFRQYLERCKREGWRMVKD